MSNNPRTAPTWHRLARRTALATLVASIGCGSGGGASRTPAPPAIPTTPDTLRAEEANRRIMAAASVDTAAGSGAAAASVDTAAGSGAAASANYRIGPEDVIDVEVFGVETFSGTYRVDQAGEIALPLLGPVPASGRTARELEDSLETRLASTYVRDPHVTVQIGEMRSHGISVIGAVNRPGVHQIPGPTTLLDVLARAEGLREDAGGTVFIVRPAAADGPAPRAAGDGSMDALAGDTASIPADVAGESVVEVDLGALLESGRAEENVVVRPGDIVQVRSAGLVYVVGEVNRPGGFTVPPGKPMSVLQALAMAQGLSNLADADDGVIVREHDDGSREEISVDLGKVLDGSEDPPSLVERDVLFVPRNDTKSFALGVIDNLVRMVTFRGLVY